MPSIRIVILIATLLLGSCIDQDVSNVPFDFTELAMTTGMLVEASNKNGSVSVEATGPLDRVYLWDDRVAKRTLIPRRTRWLGQLGAYDPAGAFIWEIFSPRIVAEDSQLHFESMDQIKKWLYQGSAVMDWVYNDTGFVVGFAKSPSRNQINVIVHQIYLNGEKPKYLEGSRNDALVVTHGKTKEF